MSFVAQDFRRAGTAIAVILLHVIVLILLLNANFTGTENARQAREILLRLLRLPQPKPLPHALPPPPIRLVIPAVRAPAPLSPPAVSVKPGTLEGLHGYLFDCAPENLANLSAEERARCASRALSPGPDETNRVLNLPSRARDAPHWQRALARKQNPALLPCMGTQSAMAIVLPQTWVCLGNGAINGFDLDDQPGYGDVPPVVPRVPNNGDPPGEPAHH